MRVSLFLLLIVVAAGCASPDMGENTAPLRRDVPEGFAATEGDRALDVDADAAWWSTFEDGRLDELIREGLAFNHDLRAAARRVDAARGTARVAGSARWPQLDASSRASRDRQVFIGIPVPGAPDPLSSVTNARSFGLNLSWEADLWGRLAAREAAAEADADALLADMVAAQLALAGEISQLWFRLCEARMQVELNERTLASFRETERVVGARVDVGFSPKLDLDLAASDRAAAEANLESARADIDRLGRALEILVGRYPSGELESGLLVTTGLTDVPVGLPIELVRRRWDLVAAERRIAAAGARAFASRKEILPRLSISGNGGTLGQTFGNLADPDFGIWSLAAGLVMPIFTGGRIEGAIARDEALRDELAELYAGRLLTAFREVESALAVEEELERTTAHLRRSADLARSAERSARDRYEAGLVDITTVLVAQRRALEIERSWLTSRRIRLVNRVELHQALGGGFGEGDVLRRES